MAGTADAGAKLKEMVSQKLPFGRISDKKVQKPVFLSPERINRLNEESGATLPQRLSSSRISDAFRQGQQTTTAARHIDMDLTGSSFKPKDMAMLTQRNEQKFGLSHTYFLKAHLSPKHTNTSFNDTEATGVFSSTIQQSETTSKLPAANANRGAFAKKSHSIAGSEVNRNRNHKNKSVPQFTTK